jgi:hypothetical protein
MVVALYLWPSSDSAGTKDKGQYRLQLVGSFVLALAASTLLLFAAGAAAKGIGNVSQLRQWVQESDDDWSQSKTLVRVTGVPRSVWDLGGDTVLLKRWLFHNPYNPVRISTVVFSLGAKLAAFCLGIGGRALGTLERPPGRAVHTSGRGPPAAAIRNLIVRTELSRAVPSSVPVCLSVICLGPRQGFSRSICMYRYASGGHHGG